MQYLACGKAVIATRLPGMVAVIPGEEQGVVYADNIDDMTREIITLLGSTERRRQLEQAGLSYVTQVHSYDKISQELEAELEKAIKEKKNEAISTGISV